MMTGCIAQPDLPNQVDEFPQPVLVDVVTGEFFGEHPFEARVGELNGPHRIIDAFADVGLAGTGLDGVPTGFFGHPKDVVGYVFIAIFGVGTGKFPSPAPKMARCVVKVSEMYLRKISLSTTCLYSAASILLRSLSAACHNVLSKPMVALFLGDVDVVIC